jgi:hypothetical protein
MRPIGNNGALITAGRPRSNQKDERRHKRLRP